MHASNRPTNEPPDSPAIPASIGALLADETRIRILSELYVVRNIEAEPDGLRFSTLRRRVGVADSGRFNYHLDQLSDTLVMKTDDKYRLTPTGERLVRALAATDDESPGGELLDDKLPADES